jgi:hypothetical protein
MSRESNQRTAGSARMHDEYSSLYPFGGITFAGMLRPGMIVEASALPGLDTAMRV